MLLSQETPQEIVLEETRTPARVLLALLLAANLGLTAFFPNLLVARGLLGLAMLWMLTRVLQRHRLRLDIDQRTCTYHNGWLFSPPRRQASFDEISAVAIERYDATPGLEASHLRSRLILLELEAWQDSFVLGFPMGPKVAVEKANEYALQLGVDVIDRTDPGEKVQP